MIAWDNFIQKYLPAGCYNLKTEQPEPKKLLIPLCQLIKLRFTLRKKMFIWIN